MHWKSNYIYVIGLIIFLCLCPQTMWIETLYQFWSPITAMCISETKYGWEKPVEMIVADLAEAQMPIYQYSMSYYESEVVKEQDREYENEVVQENQVKEQTEKMISEENITESEIPETERIDDDERNGDMPEAESDEGIRLNEEDSGFYVTDGNIQQPVGYSTQLLRTRKVKDIDLQQYYDEQKLIEDFYTIDASTGLEHPLSVKELLHKDMTIQQSDTEPQILIYHTHSQEGYQNSMSGSINSSVVGVGEILANLLREEYGYQVIHSKEQFDVQSRDYAYSYALPAIEQILKDYPTIEVVIDLHRDAVAEDRKLLTNIEGIDMAQLMFFNGLSFHKDIGKIDYLSNPYLMDNLAFSFQMQLACESYYPGLARKIYLKGYRYNMHLCPKTLLVELGAQTNTFQEAVQSLAPLARCLHIVLSGELDKEI